jgi:hypothetical protein
MKRLYFSLLRDSAKFVILRSEEVSPTIGGYYLAVAMVFHLTEYGLNLEITALAHDKIFRPR